MLLAALDWHAFFFTLFALLTCGFALAVLFSQNIVHMAFYLILSLGASAGLFFLAGAEFVGAMQLMIYVGGTLVLLIFGVMLTAQSRFISMKTRSGEWVLALVLGGSLLFLLLTAAFRVEDWATPHPYPVAYPPLMSSVLELEQASELAAQIKEKASQSQEAGSPEIKREMIEHVDQIAATLVAVAETHGETLDGLADGVQASQLTAERLRVHLEAVQPALADTEAFVGDLRSSLALLTAIVDQAAREVDIPLYESKTTTQIGMSFTGVRVDRLDAPADSTLVPGMSGYLLPFVIVSIHLLVVLVGAAYMARTKRRATSTGAAA